MINISLEKKYFNFLFISLLLIVMAISRNQTIEQGMKNLSCAFKESEDEILEDLYFADLMNNFEDYGFNELEYKTKYEREQGNLKLEIDHDKKQVDCDNAKSNNLPQDLENLHNESFIDLIINEIIKHEIFSYTREFFDL